MYIFCSSVEISPSLAKIQRETVGVVLSHSSKFKVECRDATDRSGWGKVGSFFLLIDLYFFNERAIVLLGTSNVNLSGKGIKIENKAFSCHLRTFFLNHIDWDLTIPSLDDILCWC